MPDKPTNNSAVGLARRILEEHGPFAIMLLAACTALYFCVIVPFQAQQELLTNSNRTLLDNTLKQSERLTDSFDELTDSTVEQTDLLETIRQFNETRTQQLGQQIENNKILLQTLQQFSESVTIEHDSASKKLDRILEQTKPN